MATFITRIAPRLLWIDGWGGLVVGVIVLPLSGWLSGWYNLPQGLVIATGVANLAYGSFSTTLASRLRRPRGLIYLLIFANLAWGVVCLVLIILWRDVINWLGLAHLGLEGIYVAGLGCLEWRCRELLLLRS